MGGKGSGGPGRAYRLPLMMTREMQLAHDRYKVKLETPDDFKIGLLLLRTGMVARNVLTAKELESMMQRKSKDGTPLVMDDEIDFYVAQGWITDFRTEHQHKEALQTKQSEAEILTNMFNEVIPQWHLLQPKAQRAWLKRANENSELEASQHIITLAKSPVPLENPAGEERTTTN
ncbi:MAG: hypothetical protein NWE83_06580 [Candidatus Bathyarchaeota archaeon]|nr:hypothetical protein [Candidatus Bathyarchaeota archaeon]